MRTAAPVRLNPAQKTALRRIARQRSLPARLVERARIVLQAAQGLENKHIAAQTGIMPEKVARWRNRFLEGGLAALEKDAPRSGRTRTITDSRVKRVLEARRTAAPRDCSTFWADPQVPWPVNFPRNHFGAVLLDSCFFRLLKVARNWSDSCCLPRRCNNPARL